MNAFDQLVALRPADDEINAADRAALRFSLFGGQSALADESPPDSTTSLELVPSPADTATPRRRGIAAITIAAALLIGVSAFAIRSATSKPNRTVNVSTPAINDLPAVDSILPPGYEVPPQLAALDPAAISTAPTRRDPALTWLDAPRQTISRWFVRRDTSGRAVGAFLVDLIRSEGAWERSFSDGPQVDIGTVDARRAPRSKAPKVGWRTDEGVVAVSAIGDTTTDELFAFATTVAVEDDLGQIGAPHGFEIVSVPTEIGAVQYERPNITITTSVIQSARDETVADLETIAFMMPERIGDVTPEPALAGYRVSLVSGPEVILIELDDGLIATLTSAAKNEPESLAAHIKLRTTETISPRSIDSGVPTGTPWRFGETSRGRWAFVAYVDDAGLSCTFLAGPSPGATGGCGGDRSADCPVSAMSAGGVTSPGALTVMFDHLVDDIVIRADGIDIPTTTEQSAGFTFVFGTVPTGFDRIDYIVDGVNVCPLD